jgi:hypothetical protein
MQSDPGTEWLRLTRLYAEKSDEELDELADDFGNLTDTAQQILRDERRKRSLPSPDPPKPSPDPERRPSFGRSNQAGADPGGVLDAAEDALEESASDLPREYTWKTLLRTCDTRDEAWQISEVLKRAGIESWIEAPEQGTLDITGPRVLVAADQLDEARALAARPIPQDVIEESKVRDIDFVPPACPRCGAADPLLESVEPFNQWRCDVCGASWSESAASPAPPSPH